MERASVGGVLCPLPASLTWDLAPLVPILVLRYVHVYVCMLAQLAVSTYVVWDDVIIRIQ